MLDENCDKIVSLTNSICTFILAMQHTFLEGLDLVRKEDSSERALYLPPNEHVKSFVYSTFLGRPLLAIPPTFPSGNFWSDFGAFLRPPEFHSTISFWIFIQLLKLSSSGNSRLETIWSFKKDELSRWRVC